ncbi:MAG: polyprenyl synthetase family protein [Deltaproteobacteria bacterium]|nr:polyprenyl synthetase family protein [Deltaproteobacteria bacterium]
MTKTTSRKTESRRPLPAGFLGGETFANYLKRQARRVEIALKRVAPRESAGDAGIAKSMRYSLFAGGKRLRPVLTLAASEAVGGNSDLALPFACAIELIHTYSLIHDDLPAMDDDDLRRGRPTSHKVFGEAAAILAGDGLLTEAFAICSDSSHRRRLSPVWVLEFSRLLAEASGYKGMIRGQMLDLAAEGKKLSRTELERLHLCKTGALIAASVEGGAILAGATSAQRKALSNYGRLIGLAFQITDDVLDLTADEKTLGKTARSDIAEDKMTFPQLLGIDGSRKAARDTAARAVLSLRKFDRRADPLRSLATYVVERTH